MGMSDVKSTTWTLSLGSLEPEGTLAEFEGNSNESLGYCIAADDKQQRTKNVEFVMRPPSAPRMML